MTGQTQDAGWQVGARRTLPLGPEEAWDVLTSPPWLSRWSGLDTLDADDPGVRSLRRGRVVRVRTADSLVQLRLLPAATGTTVAFHEDRLPDEQARNRRKDHWKQVLDDLGADLSGRGAAAGDAPSRTPEPDLRRRPTSARGSGAG